MSVPETTPTPPAGNNAGATSQANLSTVTSQALGMAAHNAVVAQQMGNILYTAVTAVGVEELYTSTQKAASLNSLTQVMQDMQKTLDMLKGATGQSDKKDNDKE